MSENSHTPGPWGICTNDWGFVVHTENDDGDIIADLQPDDVSMEQCAANARLIAAAPEMLATLEWLYSFKAEMSINETIRVLVVIQKARGE
jgi:hypothetical protein